MEKLSFADSTAADGLSLSRRCLALVQNVHGKHAGARGLGDAFAACWVAGGLQVAIVMANGLRRRLVAKKPGSLSMILEPVTSELIVTGCGTSVGVPAIGCDCETCRSTNPKNHRTRTGVVVKAPEGNF